MRACGLSVNCWTTIVAPLLPSAGTRSRPISNARFVVATASGRSGRLFLPIAEILVVLLSLRNRFGLFGGFGGFAVTNRRRCHVQLFFETDKVVVDAHVRVRGRRACQHP